MQGKAARYEKRGDAMQHETKAAIAYRSPKSQRARLRTLEQQVMRRQRERVSLKVRMARKERTKKERFV